ncbi:MAG: hypothetical protein HRT47_05750 [Candidatus Caenarcaniphilales bacterium]|nr:hypothetical protein [Candidatus Caenarcaniphilales bacterium]
MSSNSSKRIIDQLKALNKQADIPKLNSKVKKPDIPFADFMKKSKNEVAQTRNIATNSQKSLPSLKNIAKEINNFKFDIDDEINNIY